jgi:DNA-binding NarL/FixJ family response regulator
LKTALIFEDFEPIAEIWKMILQSMGYGEITVISNPDNEIDHLEKFQQDLILMDINLAGTMTGYDLTERLLQKNSQLKIIFVSMFSQQNYLNKALELGAKGYVVKNAPIIELKNAIQTVEEGGTYICEQMRNHTI